MEMFIHQDKCTESPEENGSPSKITRENIFQSRVEWKIPLLSPSPCSYKTFTTNHNTGPLSTDESLSIEPQGAFTNQPW